jgi:hypothetical protein
MAWEAVGWHGRLLALALVLMLRGYQRHVRSCRVGRIPQLDGDTLQRSQVLQLAPREGQLERLLVAQLGRLDGELDLLLHSYFLWWALLVVATAILVSAKYRQATTLLAATQGTCRASSTVT